KSVAATTSAPLTVPPVSLISTLSAAVNCSSVRCPVPLTDPGPPLNTGLSEISVKSNACAFTDPVNASVVPWNVELVAISRSPSYCCDPLVSPVPADPALPPVIVPPVRCRNCRSLAVELLAPPASDTFPGALAVKLKCAAVDELTI